MKVSSYAVYSLVSKDTHNIFSVSRNFFRCVRWNVEMSMIMIHFHSESFKRINNSSLTSITEGWLRLLKPQQRARKIFHGVAVYKHISDLWVSEEDHHRIDQLKYNPITALYGIESMLYASMLYLKSSHRICHYNENNFRNANTFLAS